MNNQEIKTVDSTFGKQLFNKMSRFILPIAAETYDGKMKGVGSCTLLAIDDFQHYIVTAAHVLREWGKCKLFILTETKSVEITWPFVMTKKGKENYDDTLDVAYSPVTHELNQILFKKKYYDW
jgi:hypothetical protein